MNVTAAVVAHVDRRTRAEQLVEFLHAWYSTALLVDDGMLGCSHNHLRAWNALCDAPTEWVMVCEDDALPVPGLGNHLDRALKASPAPVVSLYLGRGRPVHWQRRAGRAVATGKPFVVTTHLLHCVGVCVRTEFVASMLAGASEAVNSSVHKPIDEAITEWAQNYCLPVAYTNPSLVEHSDDASLAVHDYDDIPAPEPRVAWSYGARQSWTGPFAVM